MVRKIKKIADDVIDKRDVGYYPTPSYIARYLFEEMLRYHPDGTKVLDPAVGKGELIESFLKVGMTIDTYDIINFPDRPHTLIFHHEDFIRKFMQDKVHLSQSNYDYIVMNPPYYSHEHDYIVTNKECLQKYFTTGTFNLYALFVEAAIDIAKEGCLIGCIVPDSILFTPAYNSLRTKILSECEVLQIILCPTHLFRNKEANVNTCILILRKGTDTRKGLTLIANRRADIISFKRLLENRSLEEVKTDNLLLQTKSCADILVIDCPIEIRHLFTDCPSLGDLFECGGGVSTGNNSLYTSKLSREGFTMPFYLNINSHFICQPRAFLCDNYLEQSKGTRTFIVRHPEKISQDGIVCSSVGKRFYAAYLPALGITGVNAAIWPGKDNINWLLAYLNSSLVRYLLKGIIGRSHITTIGNVSSLPLPAFEDSVKKSLDRISKKVLNGKMAPSEAIFKIDRIVYHSLSIPVRTRRMIARFCADIIHLV